MAPKTEDAMTPLQRDIMAVLQARKGHDNFVADLETLEAIFIDTLVDRNVIRTALSRLVTRGYLKEDQRGWLLTEAGKQHLSILTA